MANVIKLRKGLDINLKGKAAEEFMSVKEPGFYSLVPDDFTGITPKVVVKEDPDNWEFVVPAKLKQLYQTKDFGRYAMPDGEMPVCFIVNTDNTGGNSGSPVFNAKGELIGTAFDRNYEGLTGDIAFRPSSQRAACVDIRYTLFIIDKYAGASHIIKELTISEAEPDMTKSN